MKTPREILLQQHRSANARLDALRREVVASECRALDRLPAGVSVSLFSRCGLKLWRELVLPCRYAWGGLAAAWLVIVAVNLALRDRPAQLAAAPPPSRELQMAMREQKQVIAELIEPGAPAPVVAPRRSGIRPRSDRHPAVRFV